MSKIKLYFLTGFLGAGKTTILRNLLENMEGTKVGVIQNELGNLGISHRCGRIPKHIQNDQFINGKWCCHIFSLPSEKSG